MQAFLHKSFFQTDFHATNQDEEIPAPIALRQGYNLVNAYRTRHHLMKLQYFH